MVSSVPLHLDEQNLTIVHQVVCLKKGGRSMTLTEVEQQTVMSPPLHRAEARMRFGQGEYYCQSRNTWISGSNANGKEADDAIILRGSTREHNSVVYSS